MTAATTAEALLADWEIRIRLIDQAIGEIPWDYPLNMDLDKIHADRRRQMRKRGITPKLFALCNEMVDQFDLPRALASPSPAVEVVATHTDDNAWFEPACDESEQEEWTTNRDVVFQEPEAVLAHAVESLSLPRSGWHAYVRGDGPSAD